MQRPARSLSLSLSLVSLDAARFDGEKQIEQRRERRNVEERKDFDNVEIRYYFHDVEIAATYFFFPSFFLLEMEKRNLYEIEIDI